MQLIDEIRQIYRGGDTAPEDADSSDEAAMAFAHRIIEDIPNQLRRAAQRKERRCLGSQHFVQGAGPKPSLSAGHIIVLKWLKDQGVHHYFEVSATQDGTSGPPWWNLMLHGWASKKRHQS